MHVITTMRSRMEYIQDVNEQGKVVGIRKVGMSPIQRPGMEYEFDIVADMDWAHILTVSKSRCSAVADLKLERPGPEFMHPVIEWLSSGSGSAPEAPSFVPAAPAAAPAIEPVVFTLEALMLIYPADRVMAALIEVTGGDEATPEQLVAINSLLEKREKSTASLDELVTQYGAARVFAAAGNRLPATDEEVAAAAKKLAGEV
jgi:hypothetical protein